jgi:hypothetical protein
MRVTRRQLRRIIKEEKAKLLAENKVRRIVRRKLMEQAGGAYHILYPEFDMHTTRVHVFGPFNTPPDSLSAEEIIKMPSVKTIDVGNVHSMSKYADPAIQNSVDLESLEYFDPSDTSDPGLNSDYTALVTSAINNVASAHGAKHAIYPDKGYELVIGSIDGAIDQFTQAH